MRLRQWLTVVFAAMAGIVTFSAIPASIAQAAPAIAALPITTYSHMLVDPAHQHLFITSGSGSSSILVTDYSGQTVATIPNEPGATGLALSSDSSTVYAALPGSDAISAISTSSLTETARYATGTGTQPTYVVYTSGKIWFGYGAAGQGGIGSIDPSTSPATVTLNAAAGSWYSAPILAATPAGELVAGQPEQSPSQLASYDVSTGTATVLAPQQSMYPAANLDSMQISPDGADVVTASGYPYSPQVFRVSDLSAAGTYPTADFANSVSIADDGTVAAGACCSYDNGGNAFNAVYVFAAGASTPLNTYKFGSNQLVDDGVALTPDGSMLFAVTQAGGSPTGALALNIIPNPEQPPPVDPTSTAVTCSPGTFPLGQTTYCHIIVTDTAATGTTTPTGKVTFSDTSGGSFSLSACNLFASSTNGQAYCNVGYTPGQTGTQTITATYGGDSTHTASSGQAAVTPNPLTPSCPSGIHPNFRWHYSANGSSGSWSGTATKTCPGDVSMGPQAMEGNLHVSPGMTLTTGYDFTIPGNQSSLTITVSNAQWVFAVSCVSGATPSASTFTVTGPAQSYQVTDHNWYPSGNQSSPLVYQGSVSVPNLCGGGDLDLAHGATFSASLG